MIVYRVSGEGLLRLAVMAAASPSADPDTILGIVLGADREEPDPELPKVAAGPVPSADGDGSDKPAKPEE